MRKADDRGELAQHRWETVQRGPPRERALGGDESRQRAAAELIETQAGTEATRRSRMVTVVVGSGDDQEKVLDSRSAVQKPVILMYVNPDFTDDTSDNTPLKGGLTTPFTNQATNVWVFAPGATAAVDPEPSQRLSAKVISPQVCSGLLVAGGDSSEVGALATSFPLHVGRSSRGFFRDYHAGRILNRWPNSQRVTC